MKIATWPMALLLVMQLQTPALAAADDDMSRWLPDIPKQEDAKKKDDEAKARAQMMGVHQALGLATLVFLGGLVVTGQLMREGNESVLKPWHRGFIIATSATYLTAGGLSLFAPKPFGGRSERLDTTGVHRGLAWLHVAGMGATLMTGMLSDWAGDKNNLAVMDWHTALGYTTFGLVGASAVVMTMEF
jgi:hypothetical protein